jgi:hypothetical protein
MTRYTNVNAPDIESWGGKRTVESAARPGGGYRGRKVYASKSDARMDSYGPMSMSMYGDGMTGKPGKAARPTQSGRIDMMDGERDC